MPEGGGVVGRGGGSQAEYVVSVRGGSGCVVNYDLMSRGDGKRGRGRDVVGCSKLLWRDSKRDRGRGFLELLRSAFRGEACGQRSDDGRDVGMVCKLGLCRGMRKWQEWWGKGLRHVMS